MNVPDPAASRILRPRIGAQDGGEAGASVHRGPAKGLRGPPGPADGFQQGGVPVGARGLR